MFENFIQNTTIGILDYAELYKTTEEEISSHPQNHRRDTKEINYKSSTDSYEEKYKGQVQHERDSLRVNKLKQTHFLIAESEVELGSLFKSYLDLNGAHSVMVHDSEKALSTFLQSKKEGKNYDVVVLDTHLKGKGGLEVAKKIRQRDNSQKIVLVTTSMKEQLPQKDLQSTEIKDEDILVMPFSISRLSKVLN